MRYKLKTLGRHGFTLTEIMIAMGVLAVGMAMIAGALNAGIQLHKRTIDDIMRLLVAENSIAMIQASMRHSQQNGITDQYQMLDNTYFGVGDLKYPCNSNSQYGSVIFMKRYRRADDKNEFSNDYDIVVIPYRIIPNPPTNSLGNIQAKQISSCNISASGLVSRVTFPAGSAIVLEAGSVVVDNRQGRVAIIEAVISPTVIELQSVLPNGSNITLTTLKSSVDSNRLECSRPVQTRTALSPEPGWTP